MKSFMRCLVAACLLMFVAYPAFSQSRNTGEIRGTVTDPTGAAISGATVTLTNVDTGEVKTFTTNANGIYDTVSTPAGNYTVAFSAPGFKKTVRGPFILQIDVITEDGQLEVGAVSDTVTVEATGTPVLETETGHLGAIFEAKTIGVLPQIGAGITGNDWANFDIASPGRGWRSVAADVRRQRCVQRRRRHPDQRQLAELRELLARRRCHPAAGRPQRRQPRLRGRPGSPNHHFVVLSRVRHRRRGVQPDLQERFEPIPRFGLRVLAERHPERGTVFPDPSGQQLRAAEDRRLRFRYDEWGGSIGGPIIKNELFFYFVRDKIYNNGGTTAQTSTVPTLAERGMGTAFPGDFDFSGNPAIYEPNTRTGPGSASTPFPNNVIPAGMADPVALKLLAYYPLPNATGTPFQDPNTHITYPGDITNNYVITQSAPNPNTRYFGRIDYDYRRTTA